MSRDGTLLAGWLRPLINYLDNSGYDPEPLLLGVGITSTSLGLPGERLPVERVRRLWQQAASLTGNPFMGLSVSLCGEPLRGDTLITALEASRDMEEACQRMCRVGHQVCDAVDLSLEPTEGELRLVYRQVAPQRQGFSDAGLNLALLPLLMLMRQGIIDRDVVRRLELTRPRPQAEQASRLAALLPWPVAYGCDHDSVVFDRLAARRQNPFWNPALAQASEALAQDELAQRGKQSMVNRVTSLIIKHLEGSEPHQQVVARELGVTPRQLQRRLKQQGYSFGQLLEQVRGDLACRHLGRTNLPLAVIARRLGFRDQSNFCKAFKRWRGETPGQYRRRQRPQH